jgi:hypothetical protein
MVTQHRYCHKESLLHTLSLFFNLALTTFGFNRNIGSAKWLVFVLSSHCVYRRVGSESLYIHDLKFFFPVISTVAPVLHGVRLSTYVIRRTSGQSVENFLKPLSDIRGLSTQQYLPRFSKHPVMRHCPCSAKF